MLKRYIYFVFVLVLAAPVAAQNNLLPELQAERAKYPDGAIPAATIATILNAVAWAHRADGWGLLQKSSGNSCPIAGTFVSCDVLIHKPSVTHWDVLNNAEGDGTGTAAAQFNLVGPCAVGPASGCAMSNFLDPVDPGSTTSAPAPRPAPLPDLGPRVTVLEEQVQSLTREIRALRDQAAALRLSVTATTAATDANTENVARIDKYLADHPIAASCRARLAGVPISCSLQ